MTRCYYCRRTATRSIRGYNLCEFHYAKVDVSKAWTAAMSARHDPPWKRMERLHLVGVLEEMLGVDKVQDILGKETWFKQIEAIRARAKELQEIAQKPKLADFMPRREIS